MKMKGVATSVACGGIRNQTFFQAKKIKPGDDAKIEKRPKPDGSGRFPKAARLREG
jgi:hypothetical protein